MHNLSEGPLEIKFSEDNNKVTMTWLGECINIDTTAILGPYFDDLFKELNSEKEFEINFVSLQYMKSSTVPYVIKLITKLNKEKINTKIVYNSILNWQIASFKALENVVKIMDFIDVIGIEEEIS